MKVKQMTGTEIADLLIDKLLPAIGRSFGVREDSLDLRDAWNLQRLSSRIETACLAASPKLHSYGWATGLADAVRNQMWLISIGKADDKTARYLLSLVPAWVFIKAEAQPA